MLRETRPGPQAAPPDEQGLPVGEPAAAPGERAVPPGERAVPPGERAVPPGERAVPPGERAVPPAERAVPPDEMVSELSIAARAIGLDAGTLATALADGQTIAGVARAHGVKPRQVVRALVSHVVASVADDIRRGELSADQVTWLVALATWRAEHQVTSRFPAVEFEPGLRSGASPARG